MSNFNQVIIGNIGSGKTFKRKIDITVNVLKNWLEQTNVEPIKIKFSDGSQMELSRMTVVGILAQSRTIGEAEDKIKNHMRHIEEKYVERKNNSEEYNIDYDDISQFGVFEWKLGNYSFPTKLFDCITVEEVVEKEYIKQTGVSVPSSNGFDVRVDEQKAEEILIDECGDLFLWTPDEVSIK